jgi:hypothetical protein
MQRTAQPTEIGQLLIDYLMLSTADRGARAMVFILLKKELQKLEMCRFLSKNPKATEDEIMEMAKKISIARA